MAYLNVRERKMETRIAYVGPFGVGKAKNLEQLGLRASPSARVTKEVRGGAEVLALSWDPETKFRDFPLAVELVAARGASAEPTSTLVREADAVVVVLDASPDASAKNLELVTLVRGALPSDEVPVVVQVNKSDLPSARVPNAVCDELGIAWPHVAASAERGEGVVETLTLTVEALVARLAVAPSESEASAPVAKTPLLGALKDVLADAIARHAERLEDRITERMDTRLAKARAEDAATIAALAAQVAAESKNTRAAIDALRESTLATEKVAHDLSSRVSSGTDDTLRGLATHATALAAHAGALAALEEKIGDPRATERAIADLGAKADRHKDELRTELGRAIENRARTDRELLLSSIAGLKGAVDGLANDVKSQDVRPGVTDIARIVAELRTKIDGLVPLVAAVKDVHRSLRDEVGSAIVTRIVKVEDLVRAVGEAGREADGELGERVKEIAVAMKAKKSWFT